MCLIILLVFHFNMIEHFSIEYPILTWVEIKLLENVWIWIYGRAPTHARTHIHIPMHTLHMYMHCA